ncbi:MAG TPA: glycosyltransferase [Bdellovibrionota bacterium]|nr:glycosyltransferase [Bdellovibrionota bacterium]
MIRAAFVIPCYQHSGTLDSVLTNLASYGLATIVVNDGSDAASSATMRAVCSRHEGVQLIEHAENRGKGVAVETGLRAALAQGYTHGIQIDADGQHDARKVRELVDCAEKFPNDLISGRPRYDASVPKARLYGRYLTHVWVWIETLSLQIKDSMCGFRVYPLRATISIFDRHRIGQRMDFDVEIMVRLYWAGINVRHVWVPVIYPEDGISHFDAFRDNVRISKMHTRLFFGMLLRFPKLLYRSLRSSASDPSWHQIEEIGTSGGIKFLLLSYRLLGRRLLGLVLFPVAWYYSTFVKSAKTSSLHYRSLLRQYAGEGAADFTTFEHVYSFARTAVDKFSVWLGDIKYSDLHEGDVAELLEVAHKNQGAFFISSHFGNIEVCRALGRFSGTGVKFNALVYYQNAQRFNQLLARANPDTNLNLIPVTSVGPDTAMLLQQKIDAREWIFVMGDRQSVQGHQRVAEVSLLGRSAWISEGPFVLAYLLNVPVYAIHCYREGAKFRIRVRSLEPTVARERSQRAEYLKQLSQLYARELETVVLADPRQWYNFFNFWKKAEGKTL